MPRVKFTRIEIILFILLGVIIITTGLIAFISPPNNWDSMTYHMSRVMHWIQNQTLSHYPTSNIRQLTYTPWAEIIIMHFQILTHSDRLANLIQWFSMTGSLVGISLIAKQFSANRYQQIITAVITATIPMGILQSSSTQNDYVASFYLISFIYFGIQSLSHLKWTPIIFCGLSLGFALLTKGTSYIYVLPFLIGFSIKAIMKYRLQTIKPLLTICLLIIIINSPYYLRNFNLTKHLLPGPESPQVKTETLNFKTLASNTIRNIGFQLGTPWEKTNTVIEQNVYQLHKRLNINIIDPLTTFGQSYNFSEHPFHEDHASNTIHTLLIFLCLGLILINRKKHSSNLMLYILATTAAILLFNLLTKWQPWGNRLQLPIYILYAPFIAIILSKTFPKKILFFIILILFLFSTPWLFLNQSRPLLESKNIFTQNRISQYFNNHLDFKNAYIQTAEYIDSQGCKNIGLIFGEDSWEYPFWILLQKNNIHIEHINVKNISSKKKNTPLFKNFTPCTIIDLQNKSNLNISFNHQLYIKTRRFNFINIFEQDINKTLQKKNFVYHFLKRIEYDQKASRLMNPNNLLDMLELRKKEFNEASLIDSRRLYKIDYELGRRFENHLMKGLSLRITGYATSNQSKYTAGKKLIQTWNNWFNPNKIKILNFILNS